MNTWQYKESMQLKDGKNYLCLRKREQRYKDFRVREKANLNSEMRMKESEER